MRIALAMLACLAAGVIVATGCAAQEPTEAPPPTAVEVAVQQAAPTEAPEPTAEEPGESGWTMEEVMAGAGEALSPEELEAWGVTYTLPDGATDSPFDSDPDDDPYRLAVVSKQVIEGDLNGDGTTERVLVLVDLADPENPQLYVAAIANVNGVWVNQGLQPLPEGAGVNEIRVVDGRIEVDVWVPTEDGTGWEMQTLVFAPAGDQVVAEGTPIPLPQPTAAPQGAPPTVGITLYPDSGYVKAGDSVDIYVNATNSPGIVQIDWFLDNERQGDGWTSPDPAGVPYTHTTFVWRNITSGTHYIFVTATDIYGQTGTSEIKQYTVE